MFGFRGRRCVEASVLKKQKREADKVEIELGWLEYKPPKGKALVPLKAKHRKQIKKANQQRANKLISG